MESTILACTQKQRALGIGRSTHNTSAACPSPREAWAQSTSQPPVPSLADTAIRRESCLMGERGNKEPGKGAGRTVCYPIALESCLAMQIGTIRKAWICCQILCKWVVCCYLFFSAPPPLIFITVEKTCIEKNFHRGLCSGWHPFKHPSRSTSWLRFRLLNHAQSLERLYGHTPAP